jgi:hypothetical protein
MKKEFFKITGVQVDETGRVVLDGDNLVSLESSAETGVATAGGVNFDVNCDINQWPGMNDYCFGPGTNPPGCVNQANCGGSQNPITCSNEIGCGGSTNQRNCSNEAMCGTTHNHSCTNTFESGCSGSLNAGGPSTPCP